MERKFTSSIPIALRSSLARKCDKQSGIAHLTRGFQFRKDHFVGSDKIKVNISRAEAADRLEQIARQLRSGSVSSGGKMVAVANDVEFKSETETDKLELEVKWR